jgi:broad specificity phosphatase PhoE
MTRLLLVRHGETEYNNTHRFAGQVNIIMNEKGLRQVKLLRDRLTDEKIDAVYSSDLQRARITAETIIDGRDLKVTECPELREISYGYLEGMTFAQITQKYPVLADQIHTSDLAMAFPGGESFPEFIQRVESFKGRLAGHGEKETVLIAAHGGPLRTLMLSLLGMNQECWWQLRIDNASLSIIETYPPLDTTLKTTAKNAQQRVILNLFNETSYLIEKPRQQAEETGK